MLLDERYWSKVDKINLLDCWEWTAGTIREYGAFWNPKTKQMLYAHRLMLDWWLGGELEDDHALHHCDNPTCVNPLHLFPGSNNDNILDSQLKDKRGRKLTWDDVHEIRKRYADGDVTQTELAEEYGTHQTNISLIVRHEAWSLS